LSESVSVGDGEDGHAGVPVEPRLRGGAGDEEVNLVAEGHPDASLLIRGDDRHDGSGGSLWSLRLQGSTVRRIVAPAP